MTGVPELDADQRLSEAWAELAAAWARLAEALARLERLCVEP